MFASSRIGRDSFLRFDREKKSISVPTNKNSWFPAYERSLETGRREGVMEFFEEQTHRKKAHTSLLDLLC